MRTILFLQILFTLSVGCASEPKCIDYDELEFFNSIAGKLDVVLSPGPAPLANLPGNQVSSKEAKIVSMKLQAEIFIKDTESFRQLTEQELESIAFSKPVIELVSLSNMAVKHNAPNNQYFTVRDLLDAVEKTEIQTRKNTEWFGGIDVHHVYFEGVYCENGRRIIYWGS